MSFSVIIVDRKDWQNVGKDSHLAVFGSNITDAVDGVDFVLFFVSHDDVPLGYITCREEASDRVYLQYGGAYPSAKGSALPVQMHREACKILATKYKYLRTKIHNENTPMLKLALHNGFIVTGVSFWEGKLYCDMAKENT